ncbi:MAG TPA: bifunctional 5,10-methylenetetrahydrofolate dehydrogenase/5,10-methenyltetrahydrofolate cyclohydrolase [Polyangiaceae bacterium]
MTAQATLLDGKALAEIVRNEVRAGAAAFQSRRGRPPGLDVILVGEDPASLVYTRSKERVSNELGIRGRHHHLPATTSEADLLGQVARLNADDSTDGILVQLPLPNGIDASRVVAAVDPSKDVDGLHPTNAGLLASGKAALVPSTPVGCLRLIRSSGVELRGARALVVGRSALVGRPTAQLLLAADATVTQAHSQTPLEQLAELCRAADVLVVAVGKPGLIRGQWVKPGAVVIDVGATRIDSGVDPVTGKPKVRTLGDVEFDAARARARAITPVPGGVGPMTIACLMQNVLEAALLRTGS